MWKRNWQRILKELDIEKNNDLMALLFGRVFFNFIKDGDYYGFTNNFSD